MSKWRLFSLLAHQGSEESRILSTQGPVSGIVLGIDREDGSGRCFNVRLRLPGGVIQTVFVRTVD